MEMSSSSFSHNLFNNQKHEKNKRIWQFCEIKKQLIKKTAFSKWERIVSGHCNHESYITDAQRYLCVTQSI